MNGPVLNQSARVPVATAAILTGALIAGSRAAAQNISGHEYFLAAAIFFLWGVVVPLWTRSARALPSGETLASIPAAAFARTFDQLSDLTDDAILWIRASPDGRGRIHGANTRALHLFGYSSEELVRLRPDDLVAKSHHEELRAIWDAARPLQRYDGNHLRKDGDSFPAEVKVRRVDLDGEPHWLAVVRDLTDRRQAEEIRVRLATVVEQMTESVMITDPDGVIVYVNPAFEAHSGFSREEAIGQKPSLLKSGRHDAAFYENLWKTIRSGRIWSGNIVNRRKDGSILEESTVISPIRDTNGRITDFLAIKTDLTSERRLQEQLLMSRKLDALGQLAGGVAHDFNNLLSVMLHSAKFVHEELPDDSAARNDMTELQLAIHRAQDLTRQLLIFSRRQAVDPHVINLNDLVRRVWSMMRRLLGETYTLSIELETDLPPVLADAGSIENALVNLVLNARDAMPDGGEVAIATARTLLPSDDASSFVDPPTPPQRSYSCVLVRDQGHGMTEETRRRIFEPFFTTKDPSKGTGLGLSTAYGAIRQHHGCVSVETEVGRGSTFAIYIPATEDAVAAQEAVDPAPAPPAETHPGGTILVAEDEIAVRRVIARLLEKLGYRVLAAASGEEALEIVRIPANRIDLLLSDVMMPGLRGPELAAQARNLRPELPVVLMTGYSESDVLNREKLGFPVEVLQKPFEREDLASVVREALK